MELLPSSSLDLEHPWPTGHIFQSPGAHLTYRVVGPCCRLFDRNQLPWPCCRLQWRGKEPSWRRVGRQLVPDMATRKFASYSVEIIGQSYRSEPFVITLYTFLLPPQQQQWWYAKQRPLAISMPEKTGLQADGHQ
ncbi:MAG: hypothetical protein HC886_01965 [Leptolyngbyaceae cyanobacterium SM1_1_3]|nr:hypothetical protein [Leptolyngbyaceae cyanobacterium SM1_1_3]NJN03105.1 hypothetical protein [Leptolyngbyaceae cyanobacterium RM1_1_2]NJO09605.1 hypothetical protein [Leptolyngbyaceae cyanobacterium SL_1_1]